MRKLKLLLASLALVVGVSSVNARVDVTSTYLTDADLSSLVGWGNPGRTDWKTDGAVNVVEFWNWSNQFNFSQTANLPAGYYRLAVNAFYRNSWTGDGTNNNMAWIFAGEKTQNVIALNSMSDLSGYTGANDLYRAATAFSQGNFSNEFDFQVTGEGTVAVEIGFRGTCPNGGWCILGPVTLYEYTAADYMEDYQAKVAVATPLLNKKMNAGVLQALQNAIVEESSLVTVDDVQNAVSTLISAINAANTSISSYELLKSAIDAFDANYAKFDSYGKAAADEAGATTAKAAYTNGTATDGSSEKADLEAAFRAGVLATQQPGDGLDMTAYITNPTIDGATGWTTERPKGGNGPLLNGTAFEYWAGNANPRSEGSFNYYQELNNLPLGVYAVSADMYNSLNSEAGAEFSATSGVYGSSANEEVSLVTVDSEVLTQYTTGNVFVVNGNMTVGVKNTVTPMAARWFVADNFKLTYVRQMTAEEADEYNIESAIEAYNEALTAAQAIAEGSVPTAVYTNLQSTITENTLSEGTANDYNTAAANLSEATIAAEQLVAPYAAWKELKAQADVLVAVPNNDAEANLTLQQVMSSTSSTISSNNVTSSTIQDATSTLKEGMTTYVTTAEPTGDNNFFDLTFLIVNPHFTEGTADNPTGWTANYPAAPANSGWHAKELRTLTHNFEAYHQQFTLSQTIPGLQKGTYKVTLQGFARHDDNASTDKTNLFCGIVNQPFMNITDEYSTTSLAGGKPALGDTNGEASYDLNGETVYQPNGMSGSYYFFQEINPATEKPFYTNEVQTLITSDGDLTIGFKCETWTDWVIWDNFHLYYYGSAIAVAIDENQTVSYTEDIDNANVTLTRTFSAGKWNTLSLPFDLTDAETKEAFGSDAQVATFSEAEDADNSDNSTVSFNTAADAAITANTPVLLKTSTTETSFSFNGKNVKAGESIVLGQAHFDFVGTYAASTTIASNDYFISGDKLWRSTGATTIKGTRAYLKAKSTEGGEARIVSFNLDGGETTAIMDIERGTITTGNVYNTAGQLVKKAQKGIYIQNGKKVVVK